MRLTRSFVARFGTLVLPIALLLAATAFAQSEYVVFSFPTIGTQGRAPQGNLAADSSGNLYGTSYRGSALDYGTVFELVRPVPPSKQWTQRILYGFTGALDGGYPETGVIFDAAGNLYGTANIGGTAGVGVVFRLAPPTTAGGDWTETVLYSFQGGTNDGEEAYGGSGLVFDKSGNLYGTTARGGIEKPPACGGGCGIVFELTPPATSGAAWSETVLHYFNVSNGNAPFGTPILDAKGNVYGTAEAGGKFGKGVVYRLTPPSTAGEAWAYRVLYAFGLSNTDSAVPVSGLTLHGPGVLYGTAGAGGIYNDGTVFQLVPPSVAGGAWTENVLLAFSGTDGSSPFATMIFDKAGNLYGTAQDGGKSGCDNFGCGTIFRLSPPASPGANWTETVLHAFPTSRIDGLTPSGGLMLSKNGVLFGVTQDSMNTHAGAVYGIVP